MSEEFFQAVRSGDLAKVNAMLERDPGLANARATGGTHAAVLALYYGRPDVSQAILARKPVLDLRSAAAVGDFARVREAAEEDPHGVDVPGPDGFTALGLAAYLGHRPIVGYLLNLGADVNRAGPAPNRFTALTGAVSSGHADVVEVLLAHGADPNHRYEGGNTPLAEAAFNGNLRIVQALLEHGADPAVRNDEGKSAVDIARGKGHGDVVRLLEVHGPGP